MAFRFKDKGLASFNVSATGPVDILILREAAFQTWKKGVGDLTTGQLPVAGTFKDVMSQAVFSYPLFTQGATHWLVIDYTSDWFPAGESSAPQPGSQVDVDFQVWYDQDYLANEVKLLPMNSCGRIAIRNNPRNVLFVVNITQAATKVRVDGVGVCSNAGGACEPLAIIGNEQTLAEVTAGATTLNYIVELTPFLGVTHSLSPTDYGSTATHAYLIFYLSSAGAPSLQTRTLAYELGTVAVAACDTVSGLGAPATTPQDAFAPLSPTPAPTPPLAPCTAADEDACEAACAVRGNYTACYCYVASAGRGADAECALPAAAPPAEPACDTLCLVLIIVFGALCVLLVVAAVLLALRARQAKKKRESESKFAEEMN